MLAAYRAWSADRARRHEHRGAADPAAARARRARALSAGARSWRSGSSRLTDETTGRRQVAARARRRRPAAPRRVRGAAVRRGEHGHQRCRRRRRCRIASWCTSSTTSDDDLLDAPGHGGTRRRTRRTVSSSCGTGAARWRDPGPTPAPPATARRRTPCWPWRRTSTPDRADVDASHRPARRRARDSCHRRLVPQPAHRPGSHGDGVHTGQLPRGCAGSRRRWDPDDVFRPSHHIPPAA